MQRFIKFTYYNIALGLVFWFVFLLNKINFWLAIIGFLVSIYLFIIISAKVLKYINNI